MNHDPSLVTFGHLPSLPYNLRIWPSVILWWAEESTAGCGANSAAKRCRMHLRQTQRTLNQTNLKKGIKNSAARHGLIKEHSVQLQSRMPLKESVSRANANTHEYSSMLAKHSSQYITSLCITILCQEHLRPQKDTKRLTRSEDV